MIRFRKNRKERIVRSTHHHEWWAHLISLPRRRKNGHNTPQGYKVAVACYCGKMNPPWYILREASALVV